MEWEHGRASLAWGMLWEGTALAKVPIPTITHPAAPPGEAGEGPRDQERLWEPRRTPGKKLQELKEGMSKAGQNVPRVLPPLENPFCPWKTLSKREQQGQVWCPAGLEEAQAGQCLRASSWQPVLVLGGDPGEPGICPRPRERSVEDSFDLFCACFSFWCLLCLPLLL